MVSFQAAWTGLVLGAVASSIPVAQAATPDWLTGINLADGAFNARGSRLYVDYTYPTTKQMDHFIDKGFRLFRVPVLSRRLFPTADDERDSTDWTLFAALVAHAKARGAWVLVDLHQFGSMEAGLVGRDEAATDQFVAFWTRMATRLKTSPNVLFGLMNEPHQQSATEWLEAANRAIAAIRRAGAGQMILVPGSSWDGASTWTKTDNGKVMAGVRDPANNFAYELHQYLDRASSGTTADVVAGTGARCLQDFTDWARAHKAKGFLDEFGFATTPEAMKEGEDLLSHMAANRDVWHGWTYWAAGAWWGNYMFSVEPGKTGEDKPQMAVLERWK